MQPSSLIFLVVIAIWAAFLVQHWLGRREHLSTARSMDRFSNAMRILDRAKQSRPEHPAASSPTRLHRPQVTMARAESLLAREDERGDSGASAGGGVAGAGGGVAASARAGAGMLGERAKSLSSKAIDSTRGLRSRTVTAAGGDDAAAWAHADDVAVGAQAAEGRAGAPTAGVSSRAGGGGSSARRPGSAAGSAAGRRREPVFGRAPRGVLVVGAAVLSVATLILAAFGLLGWRYASLSLVLTGLAVWWLRRLAAAQQSARRARRAPVGTRASGVAQPSASDRAALGRAPSSRPDTGARVVAASPSGGAHGAPVEVATATARRGTAVAGVGGMVATGGAGSRDAVPGAGVESAEGSAAASLAPAARGRGVYDIAAIDAAAAPADAAPEAVSPQADGWQPVPVPPPTYTMKARAERPAAPDPEDARVVAPLLDDEDDDVASPYAVTDLRERARARLSG